MLFPEFLSFKPSVPRHCNSFLSLIFGTSLLEGFLRIGKLLSERFAGWLEDSSTEHFLCTRIRRDMTSLWLVSCNDCYQIHVFSEIERFAAIKRQLIYLSRIYWEEKKGIQRLWNVLTRYYSTSIRINLIQEFILNFASIVLYMATKIPYTETET